ncbi:hypothetical protein CHLNCDRAFT_58262 [Chlorella variabilis]|uniref:Starch synthase, chloroplastic/amyloplastic n=1 Tax=Chlorella variabilis TaxID=554065 RepID=E1ZIL8_CHLVA|nr:hypothetical protein CHLNCDRAFT_58262 [Chlorella variabilis]EFN54355.1 hypothetical protein CHLNCDRAFT_58262 [Chlorella variabilis]|eukprot:XP_005846457.1 hypothetical protein CHLNCDRAFT_58262 [Chlorella variabilis]
MATVQSARSAAPAAQSLTIKRALVQKPVVQRFNKAAGQKQATRHAAVLNQAVAAAPAYTPTSSVATPSASKPMDIVFVSAEVAPWSKTGGLGDVVGSLPVALAQRGHRVFTIAPRYDQYSDAWDTTVTVNVDGEDVRFFHTVKKGVHRVWIDHPAFLAKTALCIHNIAFQGRFWGDSFGDLGLPSEAQELFTFSDGYPKVFDEASPADEDKMNEVNSTGTSFKKLNWLKAGILACDKLLTVSPNYATEISSGPQLGVELDKWVKAKGVEGIVNGMDVEEWSPALDKFLKFKYDKTTVEAGKAFAKSQLQREAGLPVDPSTPVFGFIGRLEEQKGVDILLAALKKLPKGSPVQVVILGTGKKALEAQVKALSKTFPGVAAGVVKFSNPMAHCITAGADFMLVPSRFEPCGLIQLHAMQYGTVPLVASTGGLVDTVKEGVTGFQMGAMNPDRLEEGDAEAVAQTIKRAAETYGTPAYTAMRDRCIAQDLSWSQPAKKWEAVLTELKYGPGPTPEATADKNAVTTPTQKI